MDEEKQQIIFAVETPPEKFITGITDNMDLNEFSLTSSMDVSRNKNQIMIKLK